MTRILHITAHLGGGVGKALNGLSSAHREASSQYTHTIACLEPPEKQNVVNLIVDGGSEVVICPSLEKLGTLIAATDIVQIEWWNHPITISTLCRLPPQPIRIVIWYHNSGLFSTTMPAGLLEAAHRIVFTSPCSYKSAKFAGLPIRLRDKFAVISSGGGLDALPRPKRGFDDPLSVGYAGSLNFSKLHPLYVQFVAAANAPQITVRLIGDTENMATLIDQCHQIGRPDLLEFLGFCPNIASELSQINVAAYLLNPQHYGTAENALIESMAMGIVPVVLDNPAETAIVAAGKTGLVVKSPAEFASAISWLDRHPEQRLRMGQEASSHVRDRFTWQNTGAAFAQVYETVLAQPPVLPNFPSIFGATPDEWFLSCQSDQNIYGLEGTIHLPADAEVPYDAIENTKCSVFHFFRYFPDAPRLRRWAKQLEIYR